jgi:hypothetical protein
VPFFRDLLRVYIRSQVREGDFSVGAVTTIAVKLLVEPDFFSGLVFAGDRATATEL